MRINMKEGIALVNTNKLRGKIVEMGTTIPELAEKIGIDKASFYRKMKSNGENFTIKEANLISKELNLDLDEVNSIFFSSFVA